MSAPMFHRRSAFGSLILGLTALALAAPLAMGAAAPPGQAIPTPDARRLIDSAQEAYRLGRYPEATVKFEQLAEMAPY
ncbi:MAG: hypothetical protein M1457_08600, partial [bacterium]|nr:hypothetical protein [bacterium]